MGSDQGKLFVGGISWETSEDTLRDHFNKYGEVVESVIIKDRNTGNARGFGFVLFSDPSVADNALQDKHVILGRTVDVKKAVPRGEQHHRPNQQQDRKSNNSTNGDGNNNNQFRTKKIFVGGLAASLTEEEFKGYFEKFGRITDVVVMYDSETQRPRGFGFITFDSEEAVENVMQKSFHELNDKLVEVKKAVPKDGGNSSNNGNYSNNYNVRVGAGRGSIFGSNQGGIYVPYNTQYGTYPSYSLPPPSGYGSVGGYHYGVNPYGGGYFIGGYGRVGYGVAPFVASRNPWNVSGMIGARRSPVPYGNGAVYPSYMNGGAMGNGAIYPSYMMDPTANGRQSHGDGDDGQPPAGTTQLSANDGKLEDDTSGLMGSHGAASGKQNQRGPDEQFRAYPPNGKQSQGDGDHAQTLAGTTEPSANGGKLEDDTSGLMGSHGAASDKQNQRGPEEQFRAYPSNGKQSQGDGDDAQTPAGTTEPSANGGKLDDDTSDLTGSYGAAGGKQSQRDPDEQFMAYHANGKQSQGDGDDAQETVGTAELSVNGGKLDGDTSGLMGSYGAVGVDQNQRGPDEQFRPYPVDNSD